MKKKLFLALLLVLVFTCLFVVVASAEDMTKYIEFKVQLQGDADYISVYQPNTKNNPELHFSGDFFTKLDQSEKIEDKTKIVKVDLSNAEAHGVSVKYIGILGAGSGSDFVNVTEIKFPNQAGFKTIGTKFCMGWTSLTSIDFGSATTIKNNAFNGCTALKEVTIPATVTYIETNLFDSCTGLTKVTILGEATLLSSAFSGCTSLTEVNIENVSYVAAALFNNCSSLTSVKLPKNATKIESKAFLGSAITSIEIPASVTSIGEKAFQEVTSLKTITFAPNSSLTSIGVYAFEKAGLTCDIVLPEGFTTLSDGAFSGTGITSITFPSTLTTLGSSACKGTSVTSAIIPDGITVIGSYAFNGCTSLTTVSIPVGFTKIGNRAFQGCNAITSLTFRGNAGEDAIIDEAAFETCYTIGVVTIPEGVTTLGNGAFNHAGVTHLTLPSTLTTVKEGSTFNVWNSKVTSAYKLVSVTGLENTKITTIPASMFRGQSKWKPEIIILPNTVEKISGDYAFADVGMSNIQLSANLKYLGNETFTACASLKNVYVPGTIETYGSNPFYTRGTHFFVTSSDTDYLAALAAKAGTGENSVSYAEYIKNPANYKSGKWIIYGCNVCETFYKGECAPAGTLTYDFSGADYITPFCSYAGCARCPKAVETPIIDELFTSKGYSKFEDAFMYDIRVNHAAIEEYKAFCKENFEKDVTISYGLAVSANKSYTNLINADGTVVASDVLKIIFDGTDYTNLQVKFNNVNTEVLKALPVHACAYLIVNGEVSYVGDGTTEKTSTTITYEDIKDDEASDDGDETLAA